MTNSDSLAQGLPAYYDEALDDAERLLKYASETGLDIDDDIRSHILNARFTKRTAWDRETVANLLQALGKLATRLRPITAQSLKACRDSTRYTVRHYWRVGLGLAIVIIPVSFLSFMTSAISGSIRGDITIANDLAVKLRAQLGPPSQSDGSTEDSHIKAGCDQQLIPNLQVTASPTSSVSKTGGSPQSSLGATTSVRQVQTLSSAGVDADALVITELQQFASNVRAVDGLARKLALFVLTREKDPFKSIRGCVEEEHATFQLPQDLRDFPRAASKLTTTYQDVRYYAQNLVDDTSLGYGALTTCLLPTLYALLGTCAYLVRKFEDELAAHTFIPPVDNNSMRFLVAAIGGAVVGLFNPFGQGASIPPLAIAFLVGYGVEAFFVFLDNMLQTFVKGTPGRGAPIPSVGGKS
jgi:hypothetical protein